jgi:hypothetical protein
MMMMYKTKSSTNFQKTNPDANNIATKAPEELPTIASKWSRKFGYTANMRHNISHAITDRTPPPPMQRNRNFLRSSAAADEEAVEDDAKAESVVACGAGSCWLALLHKAHECVLWYCFRARLREVRRESSSSLA